MIVQLAQTPDELKAQIDALLTSENLPVDDTHRQLIAGLIFQTQAHTDEVDTEDIGKQARGMLARRLLYFIMKPEKKPDETAEVQAQEADAPRS